MKALLRRKRLRWLANILYPPVYLVIKPSFTTDLKEAAPDKTQELLDEYDAHPLGEYFLLGAPDVSRAISIHLPTSPLEMAALYRGIRSPREVEVRSGISYDAEAAQTQLIKTALDKGTT